MLIDCPNCATSYRVDAASIGARGRSVRCARCRNVWFAGQTEPDAATPGQPDLASEEAVAAFSAELGPGSELVTEPSAPLEPEPTLETPTKPEATTEPAAPGADELAADEPAANQPLAAENAEAAPAALPDTPTDAVAPVAGIDQRPPLRRDAPPIEQSAENIRQAARRPAKSRPRAKPKFRLALAIAMLACICAALVSWRKDVVRAMPQLASFYGSIGIPVNLRGLAFTGVSISREAHDRVPVLVVEGTIINTVATPVEVPRLRFALRNAAGAEVYTWTAVPTQTVLEPGDRLPFRSRLASPPEDGHDVQVRFFTRRDVLAGLH